MTLAVFGGLYLSTIDSYGMLKWDEAHYATLARALARGHGYTNYTGRPDTFRPPVVPVAAAVSIRLAGAASDRAAKLPTIAFSLLAILFVYATVQAEAGSFGAIAGAVSLGIFPEFWISTPQVLTEIPFMLFYAAAVVAFYRGLYRHPRSFLLAWPLWGLATLTRYTSVLYGPTVVLVMLLPVALRDASAIRRIWTKEFFLAPFLGGLVVSPWLLRTWLHEGDPLKGFRYAAGQVPAYRHAVMGALYYVRALPEMLGWIPLVLLVAAAGYTLAVRNRLGLTCLLAAAVVIGWMTQYGWKETRLITSVLPFFAILIGLGVDAAARVWNREPLVATNLVPRLVLIVLLAAAFVMNYRSASAILGGTAVLGYPSFLRGMEYVRESTPEDAMLLGPNCHQIFWYADRRCRSFPPEAAAQDDALRGVDWVVITNFERGQPQYVYEELERFPPSDYHNGLVKLFTDQRFGTALVPGALLRAHRFHVPLNQHP